MSSECMFLEKGDRVIFDQAAEFVVRSRLSDGSGYRLTDPTNGRSFVLKSKEIGPGYNSGRMVVVAASAEGLPDHVQDALRRSIEAFTPKEKIQIARRLEYCSAIDAKIDTISVSKTAIDPIVAEVAAARGEAPVYWETAYNWWKTWIHTGRDSRALAPGHRRKGNRTTNRLHCTAQDAMDYALEFYLDMKAPSATSVYSKVSEYYEKIIPNAKITEVPSLRTFQRFVKGLSNVAKAHYRLGPRYVRNHLTPVMAGPVVTRPLERVEMDWKFARLIVVDRASRLILGRPCIVFGIDYLTKMVVGKHVSFEPPNWLTAAHCLKSCIEFKDARRFNNDSKYPPITNDWPVSGVPGTFIVDNETALNSETFRDAAHTLGCHIDQLPPYAPSMKGTVEAFNRRVDLQLFDLLPGKTFKVKGIRAAEYDPAKDAVIELGDLDYLIHKYIVDIYHMAPHEGLNRARPIDVWNDYAKRFAPRKPPPHSSVVELVGAVTYRVLNRNGIRLWGLRYWSTELGEYFRHRMPGRRKFKIKYDPADISRITVIVEEEGLALPGVCVSNVMLEYAEGLSLHQHNVIRHYALELQYKNQDENGFERQVNRKLEMRDLNKARNELQDYVSTLIGGGKLRRVGERVTRFMEDYNFALDPKKKFARYRRQVNDMIEEDEEEELLLSDHSPRNGLPSDESEERAPRKGRIIRAPESAAPSIAEVNGATQATQPQSTFVDASMNQTQPRPTKRWSKKITITKDWGDV
jgi:putative transposase